MSSFLKATTGVAICIMLCSTLGPARAFGQEVATGRLVTDLSVGKKAGKPSVKVGDLKAWLDAVEYGGLLQKTSDINYRFDIFSEKPSIDYCIAMWLEDSGSPDRGPYLSHQRSSGRANVGPLYDDGVHKYGLKGGYTFSFIYRVKNNNVVPRSIRFEVKNVSGDKCILGEDDKVVSTLE